jgi:hypothetical protein
VGEHLHNIICVIVRAAESKQESLSKVDAPFLGRIYMHLAESDLLTDDGGDEPAAPPSRRLIRSRGRPATHVTGPGSGVT